MRPGGFWLLCKTLEGVGQEGKFLLSGILPARKAGPRRETALVLLPSHPLLFLWYAPRLSRVPDLYGLAAGLKIWYAVHNKNNT